jgi:hypothetical protein
MTGFRTRITNVKLKDGKIVVTPKHRNVSQRLRAIRSKKQRVVRKGSLR